MRSFSLSDSDCYTLTSALDAYLATKPDTKGRETAEGLLRAFRVPPPVPQPAQILSRLEVKRTVAAPKPPEPKKVVQDDVSPYVTEVVDLLELRETSVTEVSKLSEFMEPKGFDRKDIRTNRVIPAVPYARIQNDALLTKWSKVLGFTVSKDDTIVEIAKRLRVTAKKGH